MVAEKTWNGHQCRHLVFGGLGKEGSCLVRCDMSSCVVYLGCGWDPKLVAAENGVQRRPGVALSNGCL